MTNLFSAFNPSSIFGTSLNWVSSCLLLLLFPGSLFGGSSRITKARASGARMLSLEFASVFGLAAKPGTTWFVVSLFICIGVNNALGLFPYIFPSTSHMVFAFALALPVWAGPIRLSWDEQPSHLLAHLVPAGTPGALMAFMVLIELVSNVIRPVTLSVRLMANLTAGHLLLCLLSANIPGSGWGVFKVVLPCLVMLVVLEVAVSLIQAYVFTLLSSLYLEEMQTKTLMT